MYYISYFQVVESYNLHGGQLVANVLSAHGVRFLFTLVGVLPRVCFPCAPLIWFILWTGGHISPILVASKARDIRVIDVRHEVNAVFAADAVARLTGSAVLARFALIH